MMNPERHTLGDFARSAPRAAGPLPNKSVRSPYSYRNFGTVKQSIIVFVILMVPVIWLLYRPKLAVYRARLGKAVRIAAVVYFLFLAVRLSTSKIDEQQLTLAAASFLLLGGVWVAAWLVTRAIEKTR